MRWNIAWMVALGALLAAPRTGAEIPYPSCQAPACTDPRDYGSYLFLPPGVLPDDLFYDGRRRFGPTGIGCDRLDPASFSPEPFEHPG